MATAALTHAFNPAGRRRRRAGAAIGAVLAALVVYALARLAIGDIHQPGFGSSQPKTLSAGFVAIIVAMAALLGWAAIAALERLSTRAVTIWTIATPVVLLTSLSMPLSGHGVSAGNRAALMLMHLAVAAVIIPLYRASSLTTSPERH
jgi:hypothetical protein